MGKYYLVDTNAALNYSQAIDEYNIVVTSHLLRELEQIESNPDKYGNRSFQAREIRRKLKGKKDKIYIDLTDYEWKGNEKFSAKYEDNNILQALIENKDKYGLITFDGLLAEKAMLYGIEWINVEEFNINDEYKGYIEVFMSEDEYNNSFNEINTNNPYGLLINQYLIIKDIKTKDYKLKDQKVLGSFKYDGNFYNKLPTQKGFSTNTFGHFKPNDIYQQLALDSLKENRITMIKGKSGTGKSLIGLNFAIQQWEKGKINKIIFFVNPTLAKNAQPLGFYTGDKDAKLLQSSVGNMLASKFGEKAQLEAMIQREDIILLPFGDIRGYDTSGMNALVYVIESQNLDKELLKLGIQRLGEDSKMIIDGDFTAQVDSKAYEGLNNGMRRVSEVFRGENYYGEVNLPIIYRSEMARKADKM